MSDATPSFELAFLTEEWAWEETPALADGDAAIAHAKARLEAVVAEEHPELACVTVRDGAGKLGLWDWVEGQAVWTAARG